MKPDKRKKDRNNKSQSPSSEIKNSFNKYLIWVPFVFAFILYGNTLKHDFTLDDLPQIVNHKYVQQGWAGTVSYTHLTLPTIYSVSISEVAVSLKKKNH